MEAELSSEAQVIAKRQGVMSTRLNQKVLDKIQSHITITIIKKLKVK